MAAPKDPTHLDPLGLDRLRAGEGSAEEREHLASCPGCREALRELEELARKLEHSAPVPAVPAALERAILKRGREKVARLGGARVVRPRPRARRWAAAAAALLLAGGLSAWLIWRSPGPELALRGDLDHSGRVDIVDAYLLALELREGARPERRWDVTGDGQVTQEDVEALARSAVSLKPEVR